MSEHIRPEAYKALAKAAISLESAEQSVQQFPSTAVNRAYYSGFYCMTAVLYTRSITVKTHQGTKSKFFEAFIKPGILPIHVADSITLLFERRQLVDYDLDAEISPDYARNLIMLAKDILKECRDYIDGLSKET